MELTEQQSLRIAELPDGYRVVALEGATPMVREPTGQLVRIEQNGELTRPRAEDRRKLVGERSDEEAQHAGGVPAVTPYTSVMD
ncbi:MAG: hypothetical protein E6G34_04430 [Actinobacteria bacterium]|nr:MAG: hypothetical protein E6G34_04430 [Actinomycetota bacterium]